MAALLACLPGLGTVSSLLSAGCCAVNTCCTLASCFTCKPSASASKALYVFIFLLSATLAVLLRYWGQSALSSWVSVIQICNDSACWGQQADYRISGAVFAFYVVMAVLTYFFRAAHTGAWLLKLLFYILLLGLTLLIPNDFWVGYSQFSRYGSILFLIVQVLIIIDCAYTLHEGLQARMEARDAQLDAAGWEPGICSNGWKVLYVVIAFSAIAVSLAGIGLMYSYLNPCPLNSFFLSETLIVGCVLMGASMVGQHSKGVLTPSLLFAYNTYLCYGSITNNPDVSCNLFAAPGNQNTASVIAGCVITVLSVTWVAYSSAGSIYHAVATEPAGGASAASYGSTSGAASTAQKNPMDRARSGDIELGGGSGSASTSGPVPDWQVPAASSPAAYVADANATGHAKGAADANEEAPGNSGSDHVPWLFHCIMALAGLYLAMATTNWGTANATSTGETPELSEGSMWARIVSQWAIYALYIWTLVAPTCCPGRDFS